MTQSTKNSVLLTILVTTLGYFVDVYDIWVFGATRVASMNDLGVPAEAMLDKGILLLNLQMVGMVLGGVVFGVLGDKMGRTRVMFISILTYSLATLANAFVQNIETYAALRFLSGFGLAGELGLGATLISEILPKEKRGIGVGAMVSLGVTGALVAGVAGQYLPWRTCYILGGVMGLLLLALRMRVMESALFENVEKNVSRGNLFLLFKNRERAMRFFWCLTLGLPTWFCYGILVTFSQEILTAAQLPVIATPILMIYSNIALPLGDITSIWLSQIVKSRRKVFVGFICIAVAGALGLFFLPRPLSEGVVLALYVMMAFGIGSWVLMTVISAEAFGTNLRATVATSVPNFARGSVVLMTGLLTLLKGHMPLMDAVMIVGALGFTLPLVALARLPETFGRDLNYLEEDKK